MPKKKKSEREVKRWHLAHMELRDCGSEKWTDPVRVELAGQPGSMDK